MFSSKRRPFVNFTDKLCLTEIWITNSVEDQKKSLLYITKRFLEIKFWGNDNTRVLKRGMKRKLLEPML